MFKSLITAMFTLVLATGTSAALADNKHWRVKHDKHAGKHYQQSRHKGYQSGSHYRDRPYRETRRDRRRDNHAAYLGAILVGSAISHSLLHNHNGAVCYERHDRYNRYDRHKRYDRHDRYNRHGH
ncbi:MAG TPA: hypothetical protein VIC02_09040 [Kineobactrum sp.]